MDVAITIFRVGVGIGAVLVGLGIVLIALYLRPVARDARALANDARRLANLAETELADIIGGTRELASGTELLTDDLAERLDRLNQQARELEERVQAGPSVTVGASVAAPSSLPPVAVARPPMGPVQSPNAREDEQIA
jgi:uncharacterized protein YoxC